MSREEAFKLAFIPEERGSQWSHFLAWHKKLMKEQEAGKVQWIFRGESRAGRDFRSSLERLLDEFDIPHRECRKKEIHLTREFMRKLHHYEPTRIPDKTDVLEWMALMRMVMKSHAKYLKS